MPGAVTRTFVYRTQSTFIELTQKCCQSNTIGYSEIEDLNNRT